MVRLRRWQNQRQRIDAQAVCPPLLRTCPRCGAGPNVSCTRRVTARVAGRETGGGYDVALKSVHDERKKATG